jgi:hypothetical protein
MSDGDRTLGRLLTILALGVIGGLLAFGGVGAYVLGAERVMTLALVLTGAGSTAIVLVAVGFVVRAWRRTDNPPVIERYYHTRDGTRTVERHFEGRELVPPEVKLLQLPNPNEAATYPELLRAAYGAGARRAYEGQDAARGGDLDGWAGDIMP